ncbi:hypothetical protein GCM10010156_05590 [Planobispora rosea]|uniref:DUF1648 domain-containing protein n=1 Tax=Planobispora rosea TaxID=35762 RepID=A0A8J3S2G7_PLARO|nr:hypothetical protein [Planobispora rosea]GGS49780.1 hypothetical protein GCM10010156_05590 [Planobispora rosea]GIH83844.1 hypothetical protein Pro02_22520 [Planobispora rosea]
MIIPVPSAASRSSGHAAPGRRRRLILTASGLLFFSVVPLLLTTLYGEHLPSHGRPVGASGESTWRGWSAERSFVVLAWFEVVFLIAFLRYWNLPQAQRVLVAVSFFVGLSIPAPGMLQMLTAAGGSGPAGPPGWHLAVEISVGAGALVLGWVAAGPLPPSPETTAGPPSNAPVMALGPRQRAVFTASAWSMRKLLETAVLVVVIVLTVPDGSGPGSWKGTVLLVLLTFFEAAQARTHLQIDGSGVTVRVPWLSFLRRTVPYRSIRFAEVRSEAPVGRYKLDDDTAGWGIVSGKGPVLALSLADDRWFVYSTREAETAAALVNGWLRRQRQAGTA